MTKDNLYVDIHVLQTIPSSNINRDDTGSPKTAIYGGTMRSRVSSQSWKRAVRLGFNADSKDEDWLKGYRTKRSADLLAKELMKLNDDLDFGDALKDAKDALSKMGLKFDKAKKSDPNDDKDYETKVLLFFSPGQLGKFAKYIQDHDEIDKKDAMKILNDNQSLDLALFGRMVADDPELNVDASCQVAHAISTHEITPEFDYFTAVDDKQKDNESGSAMLGTLEYNSSTLYRYANVNVNELEHNLGTTLAIKGLEEFIKNFALTMPTGHQNSYANKTNPQYLMVSIRKDTPVNLVSAFETPVRSRDGYIIKSIRKLEDEYKKMTKWVEAPVKTIIVTDEDEVSEVGEKTEKISDLINKISSIVNERLKYENADN